MTPNPYPIALSNRRLTILAWITTILISTIQIANLLRPKIEAREPYFTQGVPAKLIDFTLSF